MLHSNATHINSKTKLWAIFQDLFLQLYHSHLCKLFILENFFFRKQARHILHLNWFEEQTNYSLKLNDVLRDNIFRMKWLFMGSILVFSVKIKSFYLLASQQFSDAWLLHTTYITHAASIYWQWTQYCCFVSYRDASFRICKHLDVASGLHTERGQRRSEIFVYYLDRLRLQIQLSSQPLKSTGLAFQINYRWLSGIFHKLNEIIWVMYFVVFYLNLLTE